MLKLKDYKVELLAQRENKLVRLNVDVNSNTIKNKQMTDKKKNG